MASNMSLENATVQPSNHSYNYTYDENWETVDAVESVAKYILIVLAIITVTTNGVVLTAIFIDPLKCFRTPLTFLITGIVVADFLVGLVVGPVNIAEYFVWIESTEEPDDFEKLVRASQILATIIINVSFLIILVLSACQLLAIKSPKVFKRFVTKWFAVGWVVIVWLYSILFALLPEITGISFITFWLLDLYAHNVLFMLILLVLYVLMYFAFKKRTSGEWRSQESQSSAAFNEDVEKNRKQEKQFTMGLFVYGALLVITVAPMTISLGVLLQREHQSIDQFIDAVLAWEISIMLLYLKFALDPLVYVLYFPKYRQGVVATFNKCFGKRVDLPVARITSGDKHSWGTVSDEGNADDDVPSVLVPGPDQGGHDDHQPLVV